MKVYMASVVIGGNLHDVLPFDDYDVAIKWLFKEVNMYRKANDMPTFASLEEYEGSDQSDEYIKGYLDADDVVMASNIEYVNELMSTKA